MKLFTKLIIILIFSLNLFGDDKYQIEWELENPFRFFKNPNDYKQMKNIYDNSIMSSNEENSKGLAFERNLQANWENKKNEKFHTNGWASYFAKNYNNTTQWNIDKKMYDDNYANPKSHTVLLSVKNTNKYDKCSWKINKTPITDSFKCDKLKIEIPYEKPIKSNIIEVKINDTTTVSKSVEIEDILIVGLGDSYASGEGNPDIPIERTNMEENRDSIFTKALYLPRKKKNDKATWLDRRAHRSLYSYQFKTALEYSLKRPKKAVTFVTFSTSGAKTKNIINIPKTAKEHTTNIDPYFSDGSGTETILEQFEKNNVYTRSNKIKPQLELLENTIGNRKIDYLLLSTGGNDIGFSKYIFYLVLEKSLRNIVPHKKPEKISELQIQDILYTSYNRLNNLLIERVKNRNPKRIILTAYPDVLNDEKGNLCKGDRYSLNIPFGISEHREERINNIKKYVMDPLFEKQKNLAKDLNWSFVYKHRKKFKNHGFCAQKKDSIIAENEIFIIPHKIEKKEKWISFEPKMYKPYKTKQRWINIPVDSILTINQTQNFLWFRTDFGFSDEASGIFHPNAQGLAVTADANIEMIKKIEETNNY